jgi:hypothetical protein
MHEFKVQDHMVNSCNAVLLLACTVLRFMGLIGESH